MSGDVALAHTRRSALIAVAALLTGGCSGLIPKPVPPPSVFSLDGALEAAPAPVGKATVEPGPGPVATLIVAVPHAAAGFDTRRILYQRRAHQLEYFSQAEWVDTPTNMLAPLIVAAVEASGAFRTVVAAPSAAAGELRLDTEILRLQQDFLVSPSRVRFTLRAAVVDSATRRVLAVREFDATVASTSEDAYGGVVAAHRAVRQVLVELAVYCAATARESRPLR
jgi:cholesterol transport system auxiliary component